MAATLPAMILALATVSSAVSLWSVPISAVLEHGHADLQLHLLDHALAEGGDVGLLDPVDRGQLVEDQRRAGLPGSRAAGPGRSGRTWRRTMSASSPAARAAAVLTADMVEGLHVSRS